MEMKRKLTLGAATLAVALGAGHLVQSGRGSQAAAQVAAAETPDAAPTSITPLAASAQPDDAIATPVVAGIAGSVAKPVPPATGPAPQGPEFTPVPAALTDGPAATPPAPATVADQVACRTTLDVIPAADGMLELTLLSPCKTSTRVVLRHGGLTVTGRTSSGGALFTTLPAIEANGEVSAMFPDGTVATGAAPVDLSAYQRFAVQWMADDQFSLNAYEDGAVFGGPGHVHAGARSQPSQDGNHGWLIELGDATVDLPMLAQVYTWPARATDVSIAVEAPVSEATCNRDILGETLQSRAGVVAHSDITLAMPDCTAVGDFLVLNNLQAGMTTAAAE